MGGQPSVEHAEMPAGIGIDSFTGPVRVEWDREAALTALGQLSFFIDFLKTAGLVRSVRCGLPVALLEPERAQDARHSRHGDAVDIVGTHALRPYRYAATALCLSSWA